MGESKKKLDNSKVDYTLQERIQKLRQSEIGNPKLNLDNFDVEKDIKTHSYLVKKKDTGKVIGEFPVKESSIYVPDINKNITVDDFITMDQPMLDREYRRRGLGEQVYKLIEKKEGKTILPDAMLSPYSANLHKKKGMGKSFGLSEYGPKLIDKIVKRLEDEGYKFLGNIKDKAEAHRFAKNAYDVLKKSIQDEGVSNFKSLAPFLAKGMGAAATGLLSLASEAADSESLNDDANANRLLDIEEGASKFNKQIEKIGMEPYRLKATDLIDPNINTPSFVKLRNILKSQ